LTHTGPTREAKRAFEAFLKEHGYEVAPFSIENADYVFDLVRRAAAARRDDATVARLRAAYVDYTLSVTGQMEALSRDTFGREVPQVLLVHANATNADALGEALDRLAARGYRFVTLGEALADDAWRTPDDYIGPRGPSWLFRFRVAKGLPLHLELEPDPPRWVLDLYRDATERQR
jgi:peptidoglycan/xylan/chitin deacetylase (PgdA/CDA1 family)